MGRFGCVVFLMAVPLAAAETVSSVEQLLKSITDGIEAKSSDSDLAHQDFGAMISALRSVTASWS